MNNVWNGARKRIYMQEVGTRDGLQAESVFVPTDDKIALVDSLSRAGMAKVEVTAFVSPKAIPALSDAQAVMLGIERVQASELLERCNATTGTIITAWNPHSELLPSAENDLRQRALIRFLF